MQEQQEHSTSPNIFKAAKVQFFSRITFPLQRFFFKNLNYLDFLRNMMF